MDAEMGGVDAAARHYGGSALQQQAAAVWAWQQEEEQQRRQQQQQMARWQLIHAHAAAAAAMSNHSSHLHASRQQQQQEQGVHSRRNTDMQADKNRAPSLTQGCREILHVSCVICNAWLDSTMHMNGQRCTSGSVEELEKKPYGEELWWHW